MNNHQLGKQKNKKLVENPDPTASSRKKDHIALAFESQVNQKELDKRFSYEPILSAHPLAEDPIFREFQISQKILKYPIWISSMTGGTEWARVINHNLARLCGEMGLGMGLGSCRSILYSNDRIDDFDVRPIMGPAGMLFANLGIAQMEEIKDRNHWDVVKELIRKLQADGLIIHVNPLQEWLQPEGDVLNYLPIDIIKESLEKLEFPIIVKEVGQGMGAASLEALLKLPLAAVDFAAAGGTNFSKLELFRGSEMDKMIFEELIYVGHTAESMVGMTNQLVESLGESRKCEQIIISGGVKSFLDGYYLIEKSKLPAIYGQASSFLKYAQGDFEQLLDYAKAQIKGLQVAQAYLKVK